MKGSFKGCFERIPFRVPLRIPVRAPLRISRRVPCVVPILGDDPEVRSRKKVVGLGLGLRVAQALAGTSVRA